jgi:hypothetical protein
MPDWLWQLFHWWHRLFSLEGPEEIHTFWAVLSAGSALIALYALVRAADRLIGALTVWPLEIRRAEAAKRVRQLDAFDHAELVAELKEINNRLVTIARKIEALEPREWKR